MTNLTLNSKIAEQVLTTEELIILKTLFNKVQDAEIEAKISEEKAKAKEKAKKCTCMDCVMKQSINELEKAIESTSEEVTPELINHLLTSILKSKGINAEVVGIAEVNEQEQEEEQEEKEPQLKQEIEELLGTLSSPLGFLSLLAAVAKAK